MIIVEIVRESHVGKATTTRATTSTTPTYEVWIAFVDMFFLLIPSRGTRTTCISFVSTFASTFSLHIPVWPFLLNDKNYNAVK